MRITPSFIESVRQQFPALQRKVGGQPVVYFDGPGGSQVPQRVIDAVGHYLSGTNANHGGMFATSVESDELLGRAHQALADFVGASDPGEIIFGANMTTLTFALSRALARKWTSRDRILVTRLDHDANVTPWVLAARDAGAQLEYVGFRPDDCTLDLEDLAKKLQQPASLVAVGCASNAVGTINPVERICELAHQAGAEVFLDAVHFAPHGLIDVRLWKCDYLACSAYKFFGPHVGVLWGRRERLEALPAYKVRPASDQLPDKWMTGTQNHEGIAGALEAVEYLGELGRKLAGDKYLARREALRHAYTAIGAYERGLSAALLERLQQLAPLRVRGITHPERLDERFPTVALTHVRLDAKEVARRLAARGIFTWHGNYYALQLTESLGLEPHGMLRVGCLHYNTPEEIDRLIAALEACQEDD